MEERAGSKGTNTSPRRACWAVDRATGRSFHLMWINFNPKVCRLLYQEDIHMWGLPPSGSRYLHALHYSTPSQFWALSTQLPLSLLESRRWASVGRWGDEAEPAVWVQSQGQECLGLLCQSLSCFQPSASRKKWIPMASFPHQIFMPSPPSTSGGKA